MSLRTGLIAIAFIVAAWLGATTSTVYAAKPTFDCVSPDGQDHVTVSSKDKHTYEVAGYTCTRTPR